MAGLKICKRWRRDLRRRQPTDQLLRSCTDNIGRRRIRSIHSAFDDVHGCYFKNSYQLSVLVSVMNFKYETI